MTERNGAPQSPEAKAFGTWLRETKAQTGSLPPRDRTERVKRKLRELAKEEGEQGKGQEKEEDVAELQQEKIQGEARLREVIEREYFREETLVFVAAYLGCEPWQALARMEKTRRKGFREMQEEERRLMSVLREEEERIKKATGGQREENGIKAWSEVLLTEALNKNRRAEKYATRVLLSESGQDYIANENHESKLAVGGEAYFMSEAFFPKKAYLENKKPGKEASQEFLPYEQRVDYWTMAYAVVKADPKAFGYASKREVDVYFGRRIEQIGGSSRFYLDIPEGVARIEGFDNKACEELMKKDALAIIENNKEAKRVVERREQEFLKDMREMLRELSEINKKLKGTSTALAVKRGFFANLAYKLSGKEAEDAEEKKREDGVLEQRQWHLVQELAKRNSEVWPGGNNVPKYASRFKSEPVRRDDRRDAIDATEATGEDITALDFWSTIAEREQVRLAEELMKEPKRPAQEE